jgi:hypothetical protein
VYSLGVTIWQMVERRRPFEGMDGMQICALWISDPGQMVLPLLTVADNACELQPLLHPHEYLPVPSPVKLWYLTGKDIQHAASVCSLMLLLKLNLMYVCLSTWCCAGERDRRVLSALQDLVRDCTAFNPDERPTMKQVLERIRQIQRMFDPRLAAAAAASPAAAAGSGAATACGTACSVKAGAAATGAAGTTACHGRLAAPGSAAAGCSSRLCEQPADKDAAASMVPLMRKKSGVTDPAVAAAIEAANAAVAAHASLSSSTSHPVAP